MFASSTASSLATPSRPPPIRDTERDDASTSSADVLSAATLERTPRKEEGQKMKEEGKQMQGNERRMPGEWPPSIIASIDARN